MKHTDKSRSSGGFLTYAMEIKMLIFSKTSQILANWGKASLNFWKVLKEMSSYYFKMHRVIGANG